MKSPNREEVIAWLQDRRDNCIAIAALKSGSDQLGWQEDTILFEAAIDLLTQKTRGIL